MGGIGGGLVSGSATPGLGFELISKATIFGYVPVTLGWFWAVVLAAGVPIG